jgi:hypothetical protein
MRQFNASTISVILTACLSSSTHFISSFTMPTIKWSRQGIGTPRYLIRPNVAVHSFLHPDLDAERNGDLEASKEILERLMLQHTARTCFDRNERNESINDIQSSPLLSSIGRIRRVKEIELLWNLHKDQIASEAIESLSEFWIQERGSKMAQTLQKAENLIRMETQMAWNQAEILLEDCWIQHPEWAEPWYRVSLLYYHQDRLSEALYAIHACLSRKPWHIGCLSHYVRVAEAMHDTVTAIERASHRFPLREGRRRQAWIQNTIHIAKQQLQEEEDRIARVWESSSSMKSSQGSDATKEIANMDWQ